jgi:hypothetical protein
VQDVRDAYIMAIGTYQKLSQWLLRFGNVLRKSDHNDFRDGLDERNFTLLHGRIIDTLYVV